MVVGCLLKQPTHQSLATIMFEQAELRGTPQWALMVRLMQKGRLKSPHKSLFYVTGPFLVILVFLANMPFWSFWLAISEQGWVSRKKVPLAVLLKLA